MLTLDGSHGEGGGQVVRSSLALSAATGTPFRIANIRAGRNKPGILRQHLTALRAAAAVTGADVTGDELGSSEFTFVPGPIRAGDYAFGVGSAGSTMLVLQTVLTSLLLADGPSTIQLKGGTHNPSAPTFDFIARSFLPQIAALGGRVESKLVRPGYFPAGGGEVVFQIEPANKPGELLLLERGAKLEHSGRVDVSNLPTRIAEEERTGAIRKIGWLPEQVECRQIKGSSGPGNVVSLTLRYENVTEIVTAFGIKGVRAKSVGARAGGLARDYMKLTAPVGRHLADQLLLPLALLGGGSMRATELSRHTRTNADVLSWFLGDVVQFTDLGPEGHRIDVAARAT